MKRAFTLVEVLIAVGLLSLFFFAIFKVYVSGMRVQKRVYLETQLINRLNSSFRIIKDDFTSIAPSIDIFALSGGGLEGTLDPEVKIASAEIRFKKDPVNVKEAEELVVLEFKKYVNEITPPGELKCRLIADKGKLYYTKQVESGDEELIRQYERLYKRKIVAEGVVELSFELEKVYKKTGGTRKETLKHLFKINLKIKPDKGPPEFRNRIYPFSLKIELPAFLSISYI